MAGLRGGRELTIRQVANLLSSGRSWLGDLGRKVPARMDLYRGGEPSEIATPRQVGARNDTSAWCWMTEAATESWRRDLDLQVSSVFLGADEQDDYFCPRSILHREGAGRSWAMNNTPNASGVE